MALLSAAILSLIVRAPWPVALFSSVSLSLLLFRARGHYTANGGFGLANGITASRAALLLALALFAAQRPLELWAACASLVFALDGLDGRIARRRGAASEFGARFDMEVDALFVLVVSVELWARNRLDVWILIPGALRYVYVLWVRLRPAVCLRPAARREAPRSQLGRSAFALMVVGSIAALASPWAGASALAAVGTIALCASFLHSFIRS